MKWALLLLGLSLSPVLSRAATVVYTNDVLGEIEPCGCRSNPQGGMLRKSNLLKKLEDQEILQLDAGDLLFPTLPVPPALAKQSELQASFLLKTMDVTHHDAVVPGEKDFALGLETFNRLRKGTKIQFLAANLKKKKGGKFLEPHAVFTRKDKSGKPIRIAVIGLVGADLQWPPELKVSSAIAAAKKEVPALKKKADIVIALTHQGIDADKALAKAVKGIDMIIGAHSQSFLQEPVKVGSTILYQSSFRNQYVGLIPLDKPFAGEGHKLMGLDAGYESPNEITPLVKEFKTAIADLNEKEDRLAAASAAPSAGSKYQTFPKCAECHLKQFDFWRKTKHANALKPLVEANQAKNKECLSCHSVGLGEPDAFTNVNVMAERKKPGPDGDVIEPIATEDLVQYLESLHDAKNLHSEIKLTRTEDKISVKKSLSSLAHVWPTVQCENCHQPGKDHPFSGSYSKAVDKGTCLKCHTPERAPEWFKAGQPDWEKIAQKRAQITCPAGEFVEEDKN